MFIQFLKTYIELHKIVYLRQFQSPNAMFHATNKKKKVQGDSFSLKNLKEKFMKIGKKVTFSRKNILIFLFMQFSFFKFIRWYHLARDKAMYREVTLSLK